MTLSPDETQLYVTNGNLNCVAVVALGGTNSGDQVVGLIPTGWYPNSVSFSGDGNTVYVVNGKSPTGANPGWCYGGYGPVGVENLHAVESVQSPVDQSRLPELSRAPLRRNSRR